MPWCVSAALGPQDPYVAENGVMFTLYTQQVNYSEAREICNAEGAHLAVYNSLELQAAVEEFYTSMVSEGWH